MSIVVQQTQHSKPITPRTPIERRSFVGDRRATWRGSRRDADWIRHFEEGARQRRREERAAPASLN